MGEGGGVEGWEGTREGRARIDVTYCVREGKGMGGGGRWPDRERSMSLALLHRKLRCSGGPRRTQIWPGKEQGGLDLRNKRNKKQIEQTRRAKPGQVQ